MVDMRNLTPAQRARANVLAEMIRKERCPDQNACMGDKEYLNKCCSCPHGLQKLETLLAAEFGS